ncbi:MAG: CBS domain-containing protein [Chloroflexota bacterium]
MSNIVIIIYPFAETLDLKTTQSLRTIHCDSLKKIQSRDETIVVKGAQGHHFLNVTSSLRQMKKRGFVMLNDTKVQDCMTHPAMTVAPNTSIRFAQQLMHNNYFRHLPVVKDHHLVGILSSGDIRRASPSDATSLSIWEMHSLWERVKVEQVMSRQVITVKPDTSILEAVCLMVEHGFNSLPVVEDSGQLVGILTEIDVFRLLMRAAEAAKFPRARSPKCPTVIPS